MFTCVAQSKIIKKRADRDSMQNGKRLEDTCALTFCFGLSGTDADKNCIHYRTL